MHDVKTIPRTLKNINVDTKNKNINIIGDKGYINSTVFLHDDKKVNTIAPNRKNMKKRSSKYNKSKLKKDINDYEKEILIHLHKGRRISQIIRSFEDFNVVKFLQSKILII